MAIIVLAPVHGDQDVLPGRLRAQVVLRHQVAQTVDAGVAYAMNATRVDALGDEVIDGELRRRKVDSGIARDPPAKPFFRKRLRDAIGAQARFDVADEAS